MLWLYRLLFLPVLIAMSPIYLRRMLRRGGYGPDFRQRLGLHPVLPKRAGGPKRVWLQAVSVGEILAIAPVLEALRDEGAEVYLTTTTSTASKLAREKYRALTIGIGYFPIDWWWFAARAWRRIAPDLVILTEGERWPEHLWQAQQRAVPVVSINARMSDRTYARLKWCSPAVRLMTRGVTRLLPCSTHDEARFRELGVPAEKIFLTGNIKLDVQIPLLSTEARRNLRSQLGLADGLVLLGSSTWPGEEEAMLNAWREARAGGIACSLLIVPRHAERRGEIERLVQAAGVRFHFRSRGNATGEVEVAIADTTGELRQLTQLADVVFVGKSLPPHTEGQTPVEAAALAKPILLGPGMANFRAIAADLVTRGAAETVFDARDLAGKSSALLRNAERRAALAAAAEQWHRENTGAVKRTLTVIREELGRL